MNVRLVKPSGEYEGDFLAAVGRSEHLHRPYVFPPASVAEYRAYLARVAVPTHVGFFLVKEPDEVLVGVVNISEIVRGGFQSGYLGYYAFSPWARQGLLAIGMGQVLSLAFGEMGLHRLEANIQPENDASIRLVRKLGFQKEGFSPGYLKIGGEWRDHERWAIVADEWNQSRNPIAEIP
jgi:[ribosomal protein S5]-alanine N-acetyltransferase